MKTLIMASAMVTLLGLSGVTHAKNNVRYDATIISDYLFRGLTRTDHGPAGQVGAKMKNGNAYAGAWVSNIKAPKEAEGLPAQMNVYFGYNNRFTRTFNLDVSVITYNFLIDSMGDETEFKIGTSINKRLDINLYRAIKYKMWYPEVRYEHFFPYRIYADLSAGVWMPDKADDKAIHARAEIARDFPELAHIDIFLGVDMITDTTPFGNDNDKDESDINFFFGLRKDF